MEYETHPQTRNRLTRKLLTSFNAVYQVLEDIGKQLYHPWYTEDRVEQLRQDMDRLKDRMRAYIDNSERSRLSR